MKITLPIVAAKIAAIPITGITAMLAAKDKIAVGKAHDNFIFINFFIFLRIKSKLKFRIYTPYEWDLLLAD